MKERRLKRTRAVEEVTPLFSQRALEGLVVFRKIERERENVTIKLRGSKDKTLLLMMHTCMYSTYIVHTSKLVSMLNYRIKLTQID